MPTNEERREVAARLRVLKFTFEDDLEDELSAFYDALECNPRQKRWETNPYWFLADLIEPEPERTCRNVSKSTYSDEFDCSECGLSLDLIGSECGCGSTMAFFEGRKMVRELKEPNYCPNCGARVREEA